MTVQTTRHASLLVNGVILGKVLSASLNISQEAMENTTVEKYYSTFIPGKKTATGSVTLLYDPDDATKVSLLQTVLNGALVTLDFVINSILNKSMTVTAFVTQYTAPFAVKEALAISLSLQVTDAVTLNL